MKFSIVLHSPLIIKDCQSVATCNHTGIARICIDNGMVFEGIFFKNDNEFFNKRSKLHESEGQDRYNHGM